MDGPLPKTHRHTKLAFSCSRSNHFKRNIVLYPNNPNIYSTIEFSVNCLKNRELASDFHNMRLLQRQPPNLKKRLIKVKWEEVLLGMFSCNDKMCECCNHLLISIHYTCKNIHMTFKLKHRFTCDSFNLIYVVICDTYKEEYFGETGV